MLLHRVLLPITVLLPKTHHREILRKLGAATRASSVAGEPGAAARSTACPVRLDLHRPWLTWLWREGRTDTTAGRESARPGHGLQGSIESAAEKGASPARSQ
jgi:hypothetical protein